MGARRNVCSHQCLEGIASGITCRHERAGNCPRNITK